MKLLLNTRNDKRLGSDRIWIYDLFDHLRKNSKPVFLNDWLNYSSYDAVLFGKGTKLDEISRAKKANPNAIIGLVNPSDSHRFFTKKTKPETLSLCDFFIVGSVEEQAYYMKYKKNSLIYPLVEEIYTKQKNHFGSQNLTLVYHGNLQHLEQIGSGLMQALNRISIDFDFKLKLIYDYKALGKWKHFSLSNRIRVEHVQWKLETVEDEILEGDIGLVPAVLDYKKSSFIESFKFFSHSSLNSNDYLLRFKNTSNSGRAIVFMQLGIPVVAGFAPSNFELIGNNKRGFLAHSSESWEYAIRQLMASESKRKQISLEAITYIQREYDLKKWSNQIYCDLELIYFEKLAKN